MAADKTILVVDDDPDFVLVTQTILENAGYKIVAAGTVDQAQEALDSGGIDLIILDVMLARETEGFHFARAIKDAPKTANIPILMMTAIGQKRDFTFEGEKDKDFLPIEGYLAKPASPDQLQQQVQKLLG